jgi:hypothetical protein
MRRRWVYIDGEPCEVTDGFVAQERPSTQKGDAALWGDSGYRDLRATDGADISTRSKHRAYMQARGLTTIDDFKETTAAALKRKAEYVLEGKHGAVRREHIERAIHDLQQRRK